MATSAPDMRALEQTRQRLAQLTSSLSALHQSLLVSDPLPPWSSLQSSLHITAQHLATLSTHLAQHAPQLNALAAVPLPSFPGREHEALLTQLLRKKLEPRVADWAAAGMRVAEDAARAHVEADAAGSGGGELDRGALTKLWEWAGPEANEIAKLHPWGGRFTLEEMERGVDGVLTGLRRPMPAPGLREDDEDEDDDDDDDMDVDGAGAHAGDAVGDGVDAKAAGPALGLSEHLRYMATGMSPNR